MLLSGIAIVVLSALWHNIQPHVYHVYLVNIMRLLIDI